MKKRLFTTILAALLLVSGISAFTGCAEKEEQVSGNNTTNQTTGNNSEEQSKENTVVPEKVSLTNVSYDPTRELYEQYNAVFAEYWKGKTGQEVEITQSHGGSGKQAEVKEFLNEYAKIQENSQNEFFEKWLRFDTYRKVVIHSEK